MQHYTSLTLGIEKTQNFVLMKLLNVANERFTAMMIPLKAIPKTKRTGVSPMFAYLPVAGQLNKSNSFFTATHLAWHGQAS